MNNVQETIEKIRGGVVTVEELSQYIDSSLLLVKANAILAIIKQNISESSILLKLYETSLKRHQESKVIGAWNNGHLATAALKMIKTRESQDLYEKSIREVNIDEKIDIERLIDQLHQMM